MMGIPKVVSALRIERSSSLMVEHSNSSGTNSTVPVHIERQTKLSSVCVCDRKDGKRGAP